MVLLDSPSYFQIGFIFNFNEVFIFKFLNLYAELASLWGAHTFSRHTSH
jgi:hypothetical protein